MAANGDPDLVAFDSLTYTHMFLIINMELTVATLQIPNTPNWALTNKLPKV